MIMSVSYFRDMQIGWQRKPDSASLPNSGFDVNQPDADAVYRWSGGLPDDLVSGECKSEAGKGIFPKGDHRSGLSGRETIFTD
jgi:hypothetical protein